MKKAILAILLLAMAGSAFGQATPFQQAWTGGRISGTLDAAAGDTLQFFLPSNRGKGLIMGYFWADSLKASTEIDSLNLRYRQLIFGAGDTTGIGAGTAYWPHSAAWGSAGTLAPWAFAKIYKGVSQGTAIFDSAVTATAIIPYNRRSAGTGGRIPILFDMDGYPWRGMQIWLDSPSGVTADSIGYYLELDID